MSSLWYRVTDAIDGKLTDAVHKGDGKRWAKTVKLGHTYYTIKTTNRPWGSDKYLDEHIFTKLGLISALPDGAESVYNVNGGNVYADRNEGPCKGLMTFREYCQWVNDCNGPNINGNLNDYADPDARRAGSNRHINVRY